MEFQLIAMGNAFFVFLIRSLQGLSSSKSLTADANDNLISKLISIYTRSEIMLSIQKTCHWINDV
jgi:hypothetical protein